MPDAFIVNRKNQATTGFYAKITWACRFATLAIAAFLSACGSDAPNEGQAFLPPVTAAHPLESDVTEWDEYTGRFEAVEDVDVQARVSGYLQSVHFDDGQIVEKGALLFIIDPRPFEAAKMGAEAGVARAKARLDYTETEAKRAEQLLARQNISREQHDLRLQERNQAKAELEAQKASLRMAELDLEFTKIQAPITGRVSNAFVKPGNLISGGNQGASILTRIVSLNPIHFTFDASEAAYLRYTRLHAAGERPSSRIAPNPVKIKLQDEQRFTHDGLMDFVDNQIDPSTGTMRGRALVQNPDHVLIPGIFGRLRLKGKGPYKALLIPDSAILADQTRRLVYVLDASDQIIAKVVETGALYRGLRIIKAGLTASDRIVLDGLVLARPGTKVMPVEGQIQLAAE